MLITPIKSKSVAFQLPAERRASTAPARSRRYHKSVTGLHSGQNHVNTSSSGVPIQKIRFGIKPDLIADILDSPKTPHPNKSRTVIKKDKSVDASLDLKVGKDDKSSQLSALAKKETLDEKIPSSKTVAVSNTDLNISTESIQTQTSPSSRLSSGHESSRGRSPQVKRPNSGRITQSSQVNQIAGQVRDQTNASCHDYVRAMKYDVAKLREQLIRTEEELKHLSRGRSALEAGISDVRKCLSVNQKSISTQQKKSKRDEVK